MPLNEAIIIKPLLSGALTLPPGKITTATPEKMLVDIVAEPNLFRAQQGELELIFVNAFGEMPINLAKILQYAQLRPTLCCGVRVYSDDSEKQIFD